MRSLVGQNVLAYGVGVTLALLVGASGGQVTLAQQVEKNPPIVEIQNDILQRKDKDLRQRRIDEVLAALKNPDASAATRRGMLQVLRAVANVPFDRAPFLPLIKGMLNDSDPSVRAASLGLMPTVGAGEADLAEMARLADDPAPEVRAEVVSALGFTKAENKDATVFPVVDKLLDDPDPKVKLATIHALWGHPVSLASEAKIIALTHETMNGGPGALGQDAVYYALSTRPQVSLPIAQRLAELMHDPKLDPNVRWRAAWGLTHIATPEAKDAMVQALCTELDETLQPQVRSYAVQGLALHRTPAALAKLKELAENEEDPGLRARAAEALK